MPTSRTPDSQEEAFLLRAKELYRQLRQWREQHPEASFDEIAQRVVPYRQELIGLALQQLACLHGTGEVAEGRKCEHCGRPLVYKGRRRRTVEHLEAEVQLDRAYYHCPHCAQGIFPPGPSVEADEP